MCLHFQTFPLTTQCLDSSDSPHNFSAGAQKKTRSSRLESRSRMPFRRRAIRGHSPVAPPLSRFNQSEPSSQDATRGIDGITELVPSFLCISINDTLPTARRFVREIGKRSVERSKNTSVSFHGRASSDVISRFTTQCGAQQKHVCHVSWLHLK